MRTRLVWLSPVVLLTSVSIALAAPQSFRVEAGGGWSIWQAEQAGRAGLWAASTPSGSGARFVQPEAEGAALEFPFSAERAETLRVKPVWWPTGEQKLAKRFPYPLAHQPGPDAIGSVGSTVFTTAPAAGRVIAIDARTEQPLGAIEVGGYLSDLVADRDQDRVYVADALGDRVVAIDAKSRQVLGALGVPGGPWALAYAQGKLCVGLREAKRLLVFDTTTGQKLKEIALPAAPINLEVTQEASPRVIVRYQQAAFDVFTLAPAPAEKLQFEQTNQSGRPRPGCGGPDCRCQWYEPAGPHRFTVGGFKGERTLVDVSSITQGEADPAIVRRFGDDPGPASPVTVKVGNPAASCTFFTSPSRGVVGILDKDGKPAGSIAVGGYLSDLISTDGKLYAADAAGNRVVVIDPETRKMEAEVAVPGGPSRLMGVSEVAWQRPEEKDGERQLWPPVKVNKLYVVCRESKDLAAVDLASRQVVQRALLPTEVRSITYAPPPDNGWWDVLADERIPFAMEPRLAVEPRPSGLDLATLELSPAPLSTPVEAAWHGETSPPGAAGKRFAATDQLVVTVDKTRAIDISALADPQLLPDPALSAKETPGSITISIDNGPEFDWAAGRWIAPDNEMFLVNESEEFWRSNALAFQVGPGQHTLRVKAHSRFARLDAVAVRESPALEVTILPEPRDVHGAVPLAAYQGVFYDQEPVLFTMWLASRSEAPLPVRAQFALTNYLGETSEALPPMSFSFDAHGGRSVPLRLNPKDTGRFTLTVTLDTPEGQVVKQMHFLRLPKLEHPRMFLRKEDIPAMKARIAQYPTLFRRYGDWLERMSQKEGRFPERFLPPDMTAEACAAAAPASITDKDQATNRCGWRNYELGWRVLASELALNYLKPDSQLLKTKIEGLRAAEKVDRYVQFHHHGPFFPGVDASLLDLAPDPQKSAPKVYAQMAAAVGDMNVLPWTLETLEEPLTPEKRALIYRIMNLENNAEQYFTTHAGSRGGTFWQNPYTWCNCPLHGYVLMFMFLHNVFGEPRLFEKPMFSGFLTFERYADPLADNRDLQPFRRGPDGEPWHWIFASLTKHPLEKSMYQWDAWLKKMNGPLPGDEQAAVDKLMALEGITLRGPMNGAANYFVSAVSVPMALALGWYDPKTPEVTWKEAPSTTLFDAEGWAAMRASGAAKDTEVSFVCGVRDHTYRTKPNHFTIVKSGQYLIGTPALLTDDGNNTGAWGNSVVIDGEWPNQWSMDLQHPRDGEHNVINRFSPASFTYLGRDKLRFGYQAAESGWGGGLDLHGHTETLFMQEGRLLAYQTWPGLDFAAGDALNAWPVEEVSQLDRQLVFVKPDLVVVYDRVKLGPNGHASRWIAATGPELKVAGDSFAIRAGSEHLAGRALLPEGAVASTPEPFAGWVWKRQRLLEIAPARQAGESEYLVVMRVGGGERPLPEMRLIHDSVTAGVALRVDGREVSVRLNRTGPVGGRVEVSSSGGAERYELREAIEDSYRNWQSDPRYPQWTREARFGFVIPKGDRK